MAADTAYRQTGGGDGMDGESARLVKEGARLYGFEPGTLKLIRPATCSPSDIYSFFKDGRRYILRIAAHDGDHTGQTLAEMEWLSFLAGRGIPVSMPLPMSGGARRIKKRPAKNIAGRAPLNGPFFNARCLSRAECGAAREWAPLYRAPGHTAAPRYFLRYQSFGIRAGPGVFRAAVCRRCSSAR